METKPRRIELRLSPDQRALFENAAAHLNLSVTDFVLGAAEQVAKVVREAHERIQLDHTQSRVLANSLLSPPSPNEALQAAAKQYRRQVR